MIVNEIKKLGVLLSALIDYNTSLENRSNELKTKLQMDKEKIIEAARKMLPYTTECKADNYIIPVDRQESFEEYSSFSDILNRPLYYQVTFRKQIINDVEIGWEFVSIDE